MYLVYSYKRNYYIPKKLDFYVKDKYAKEVKTTDV